jgi:hypothetical protein
MPATAFQFYNRGKRAIGSGAIQLGTSPLKMKLATSASNASTPTLSTFGSITNEVANGNGYVTGGKALASMTWTAGASAAQMRFDAADLVWTASGGTIPNVKFGVIGLSGDAPLVWSRFSTSQFSITDGNTLTVQFNAAGIFNLV